MPSVFLCPASEDKPIAEPIQLFFLPGALGRTEFWQPLAERLAHPARRVHFGWRGFGPTPPDERIWGIDDLVAGLVAEIDYTLAETIAPLVDAHLRGAIPASGAAATGTRASDAALHY